MSRITQTVIGVIAILLALGAGIYGRDRYLQEVSTYQVPVPVSNLPAYTVLTADDFRMREMPRTLESLPYYQSVDDLTGLITTVALPAGLPIPNTSAQPVAQFRLADASMEVLSIPVKPVSAVGGQVRIGERVNLYQVLPDTTIQSDPSLIQEANPAFTVTAIASDIQVVDVRNAQGVAAEPNQNDDNNAVLSTSTQTEQVQILTLAVPPEEVGDILNAVATAEKMGGLLWTSLATP